MVRALFDAAVALVRQSSSGTVVIARLDGVVDLDAVPPRFRARFAQELDAAAATVEPLGMNTVERELRPGARPPPRCSARWSPRPSP